MQHFLQAMAQCGFRLFKADVEKGFLQGRGFRSQSGVYQELEFKPQTRQLNGIQEVEVSFVPQGQQTHALIEIDTAFRKDSYRSVSWSEQTSIDQLCRDIQSCFTP